MLSRLFEFACFVIQSLNGDALDGGPAEDVPGAAQIRRPARHFEHEAEEQAAVGVREELVAVQ